MCSRIDSLFPAADNDGVALADDILVAGLPDRSAIEPGVGGGHITDGPTPDADPDGQILTVVPFIEVKSRDHLLSHAFSFLPSREAKKGGLVFRGRFDLMIIGSPPLPMNVFGADAFHQLNQRDDGRGQDCKQDKCDDVIQRGALFISFRG